MTHWDELRTGGGDRGPDRHAADVGANTLIAWAGVLGVVGIALSVRQDIN